MVLRLAGEAGQVSLARSGDSAGLRASVDQHACEVRDALTRHGGKLTPAALLSYAQGFTEAAIGRGWWPPHRRELLTPAHDCEGFGPHYDDDPWLEPGNGTLDWESLRLAAVCRMLIEAQGLAV
ncbi:MAG: hypothetical protein J2P25_07250 [Nocardiopsaceae bacterium]|nr:hypothetical protein [Nocardiopsaceae bacterium]